MPNESFYPNLGSILKTDDIPEILNFLKPALQGLLDNVYYKKYRGWSNAIKSYFEYDLELLFIQGLSLDLFDSGFRITISPDATGTMTCLPVTLSYNHPIAGEIRGFSAKQFSFSPDALFELFGKFVSMTDATYVSTAVNLFCGGMTSDGIRRFVDSVNAEYHLTGTDMLPYPTNNAYDDMVEAVVSSIGSNTGLMSDAHEVVNRLYFNIGNANFFDNLNRLSIQVQNMPILDYIKSLIIPHISATLDNLSLGLVFPRKVLSPFNDEVENSILMFEAGTLNFDSESGISFDAEMSVSLNTPSQIGSTGLGVDIQRAKLDISTNSNIAEADTDGRDNSFVGVYVERAEVTLPTKWFRQEEGQTLGIYGEQMLIGTGGFSGRIGLRTTGGGETPDGSALRCRIGSESGFEIGFRSFDITLQQNMFTETNINGYLIIPLLKDSENNPAQIDITAGVTQNGDWTFTASETQGIRLKLGEVLNFDLRTLSVGQEDGRFYVSLSCALSFGTEVSDKISGLGAIELSNFRIWQDGRMELPTLNGALSLKKPISIKLFNKAEFTITAIHMGSERRRKSGVERQYMFIGLDCGLSTGLGGVEAKGNGLKFYFTTDNGEERPFDCFVKIQGININLTLPGDDPDHAAVILNGYLQLVEEENHSATQPTEDEGPEYIGGINMSLPKLQFAIDANMRMKPKKPAFLVDVDVDMPVCIPLGPTGAGIYGFRGLVGMNYVARKSAAGLDDNAPWWQYYKAKVASDYREGIQVSKFVADDGFSLGAGVSLATAFDSGRIFSAKLFMMLSLPDVFLLEGQGAILKERIGLDSTDDPPFYAMIAISDESVETALGLDLSFPDSGERKGWLVQINGRGEIAFYWGDAAAWHIYLGRQTPEEQRIRAKVLNWFYAYMYLMIDKTGIRTGAGAGFDFGLYLDKRKRIGIEANAYLDLEGRISFHPMQLGGAISIGGGACIKIFMFKLGIQLGFALAAEAPQPYNVSGELSVKFDLPWPIEKLGGPYKLKFGRKKDNDDFNISEIPLLDSNSSKAVNMQTGEQFDVVMVRKCDNGDDTIPLEQIPLIPVDSYIDIEFKKGMGSNVANISSIGEGYVNTELIPPQPGPSGQISHTFTLESLTIEIYDGSGWVTYNPSVALQPASQSVNPYPANMAWGYWQCISPGVHNKLRLYARSPLSYMDKTQNLRPENLGYEEGFLLCRGTERAMKRIRFERTQFTEIAVNKRAFINGAIFIARSDKAKIVEKNRTFSGAVNMGKAMETNGTLEVKFTERIYRMTIYFETVVPGTKISVYNGTTLLHEQNLVGIDNGTYSIDISGEGADRAVLFTPEVTDCRILTENGLPLLTEDGFGLVLENAQAYTESILLYGIDIMLERDYLYNKNIPTLAQVRERIGIMEDGFRNIPQPVWRPDSAYRIALTTSDNITGKASKNYGHTWYIYFRTAGPIGFYDTVAKNRIIDIDNYSTLQHYIDFKHSYPAVDGLLTDAKPMYYDDGPKIHLVFLNDYMNTLYRTYSQYKNNPQVTYNLSLSVSECSGDNAAVPTNVGQQTDSWIAIPSSRPNTEISTINSLSLTAGRCELTSPEECIGMTPITPKQQTFASELAGLKAERLYSAVYTVSNGSEVSAPVHEFVFRTSVFASFDEHIESFVNEDGNNNLFEITCNIDSNGLSELRNSVNNDRNIKQLLPKLMGIQTLPPSEHMEVNILSNADGSCIGLLVRSVEPIFDPRIETAELKSKSAIFVNPSENIGIAFSNDRTMALIINSVAAMAPGTYTIQFKNLTYDITSDTYTDDGTKSISFNI